VVNHTKKRGKILLSGGESDFGGVRETWISGKKYNPSQFTSGANCLGTVKCLEKGDQHI